MGSHLAQIGDELFLLPPFPDILFGIDLQQVFAGDPDETVAERRGKVIDGQSAAVILLLDRGTIDGAAYWPDGPDDFWRDIGTTRERELKRYDAVILLETSAALGLYDGDASNFCRFEDSAAAIASGKILHQIWSDHPNLRHVNACASLDEKVGAVEAVVHALIGD